MRLSRRACHEWLHILAGLIVYNLFVEWAQEDPALIHRKANYVKAGAADAV